MRDELIALDLETTGLDPTKDAIIEIGAVRMVNGVIVDEFSALVNPGIAIPQNITHLTGIRTEHVLDKPGIQALLPLISTFVGTTPIIGHSVGFDTSFLRHQGILRTNSQIDTYDLAAILLPTAHRYTLSSLTDMLGITLENAHRALDDARASALLYWSLWEKVLQLPVTVLKEISALSEGLNWDARPFFMAAYHEVLLAHPDITDTVDVLAGFTGSPKEPLPLSMQQETMIPEFAPEGIADLFSEQGQFAAKMPGYEFRSQQVDVARAVAESFSTSQHIIIEAGTGTGKSLAYLAPAALWALANNARVVVSTNTINLQEQLFHKDIPIVQQSLGLSFETALVKGRGNYLCPRRFAAARRRRPNNIDELRALAKILVWLLDHPSGNKSEISLRGNNENIAWSRLSAEDENCTGDMCAGIMQGICPYYKARKKAESAQLLIVNHALLLSDVAANGHILPEYQYLIVDEAHHLEEAITNGLGFNIDEGGLRRRVADIGGLDRGFMGDLLTTVKRSDVPPEMAAKLVQFVGFISAAASDMESQISSLFNVARTFIEEVEGGRSHDFVSQIRITPQRRNTTSFAQLQAAWSGLQEYMDALIDSMRKLAAGLARLEKYTIPNYTDFVSGADAVAQHIIDIRSQLAEIIEPANRTNICWITAGQDPTRLTFNSAPLHIGDLLNKHLWSAKKSVILTSATLQTHGTFDYIRERLHAEHIRTLDVGSPFDYKSSTLIFLPEDMPEPNERHAYQQAVERSIIELAAALDGRVLGLFTSYTQLRQTAQAISPRLALGNIAIYDQSDGSSRQSLLEGFKTTEKAVLLGTKSFWEGVDIPGETLSAVVMTRLPFAVPTDAIFAARSESYSNSFDEYALPDTILRFRQGFGRLIRTKHDRGIVVVLDKRMVSKSYGINFLESLPECTVHRGRLSELPDVARKWVSS